MPDSGFNHAKKILMGRKIAHHITDANLLPSMQYGSLPGRQCLSASLNKVLMHDYVNLTKTAAAFMENDAISANVHLVNSVVPMTLTKLGIPPSVTTCLGAVWDATVHQIKTAYGISDSSYTNSPDHPLFGPGQGSTCGPGFYTLCYWLMVRSLDPTITTANFLSACKFLFLSLTSTSFVDNTSLVVTNTTNSLPLFDLVSQLPFLAEHWKMLLFSNGGAIHFQKSHWYLLKWYWQNGKPRLMTTNTLGQLQLTSGYNTSPIITIYFFHCTYHYCQTNVNKMVTKPHPKWIG
jgi:hypothetical protein